MKKVGKLPRIRVAGLIILKDKLLVVNHVRDGQSYYLLPGGGLEWGENFKEGLIREFDEELSVDIKVGQLICINDSIAPDYKRHIVHLTFKATLKPNQIIKVNHDHRIKGARWLDKRQFKSAIFYPEIRKPILAVWEKKNKGGLSITTTPWT